MADEQYPWLNRETAERLLRGEPLETVDAAARGQAERLAGTLAALSAEGAPAGAELPGEEGALAAFRKARGEASESAAVGLREGSQERRSGAVRRPSDAGLVRIGSGAGRAPVRRRRARPVRLALAAALVVGAVGGVAVAAGTGVLPVPFGEGDPGPAASVSVAGTPEGPLLSPSAPATRGGPSGPPTPSAPSGHSAAVGTGGGTPGPDAVKPGGDDSTGRAGSASGTWGGAPAACRDLQDGKELGSGRARRLETAAGGPTRVPAYCKSLLKNEGGSAGEVRTESADGKDEHGGKDKNGIKDDQDDQGDQGDQDGRGGWGDRGGGGDGGHPDKGRGHDHGHGRGDGKGNSNSKGKGNGGGGQRTVPSSPTPAPTDSPAQSPGPSPSPTYTAL
ncbi:hypothetical protein ACFC09_05655 [Streptomyces sp. NPDC056161]|uniref:hypothetical protein n=1 Tax=Streptomyces sp. NPDC056161 TaxID=3345732 RepID=UPI0035D7582B